MGLVDDEQIEFTWVGGFAIGGQHFAEEAQRSLALEEVDGGDEAGEVCPGVDVQAALAPEVFHQVAIDDAELQAEFVAHLVTPLYLQRGGADDEDFAGTVTNDEFLADEPGFDGFAEANVIGDEQVDARHLDGSRYGVELVVF